MGCDEMGWVSWKRHGHGRGKKNFSLLTYCMVTIKYIMTAGRGPQCCGLFFKSVSSMLQTDLTTDHQSLAALLGKTRTTG